VEEVEELIMVEVVVEVVICVLLQYQLQDLFQLQ
jgi:hypothetical protein